MARLVVKARMRMLALGSDVAPTVTHCVWLPAVRGGRILPWERPGGKTLTSTVAIRVWSPKNLRGFTLLELLLVVAIIAVASAGVSFALRDSAQTQLEREGLRLAALLESARARSLASGVPVHWRSTETGFVFEGLPKGSLPDAWLSLEVTTAAPVNLLLGPEPIIGAQTVKLVSRGQNVRALSISTDGVRPFSVQAFAPSVAP